MLKQHNGSVAVLDVARGFGFLCAARRAVSIASEMASENALGCVALQRCSHVGRLGSYPERIARPRFRSGLPSAAAPTKAGEWWWCPTVDVNACSEPTRWRSPEVVLPARHQFRSCPELSRVTPPTAAPPSRSPSATSRDS